MINGEYKNKKYNKVLRKKGDKLFDIVWSRIIY